MNSDSIPPVKNPRMNDSFEIPQEPCQSSSSEGPQDPTSGAEAEEPTPSSSTSQPLVPPHKSLPKDHSFLRDHTKLQVVIGLTGSVAAMKFPELVAEIKKQAPDNRIALRAVTTEAATHFFDPNIYDFPVYRDRDEWEMWESRGDPVLHVELRKWADLLVLAPLDANTLGKMANGLCDNLLTSLIRAWDPNKPLYFCPSMNTYMLEHPLTFKHLDVLKNLLGYKEIPSVEKTLMCGDKGFGAMAPVEMIASVVVGEIKKKFAFMSS